MAFFLGMTLLLVDIFRLTAAAAGGKLGQDIPDALQADYQNTSAFQFYMEGYLQDFLAMASGGSVSFFLDRETADKGDILQQEHGDGGLWLWKCSGLRCTGEPGKQ